jgi:hypothetical protein
MSGMVKDAIHQLDGELAVCLLGVALGDVAVVELLGIGDAEVVKLLWVLGLHVFVLCLL